MILSVAVKNFKSLVDFRLDFEKFTCLVGLNGAGKSTMLQALDFLGNLMLEDVDVNRWLASRRWKASDMLSRTGQEKYRRTIHFEVEMNVGETSIRWSGGFNCTEPYLRCTSETVETLAGEPLLRVLDGQYSLGDDAYRKIDFKYQGSVLSRLKMTLLKSYPLLLAVRDQVASIQSLDLLSPSQMKERARERAQVGLGGEGLAAYIFNFSDDERHELTDRLRRLYPLFESMEIVSMRSGWKDLEFLERYGGGLVSGARHINDGLLRLVAILAHLVKGERFLLFDEIENGINPEIIGELMRQLVEARQQVVVTTHSPMILNWLDDETARRSVVLLYRNERGHTRSMRFFDLPDASKKLGVLGPGEVFLDTYLGEAVASLESNESVE